MKRKSYEPKKIYTFQSPQFGKIVVCEDHSIDIMRQYPGAPGHQGGARCEYCRDSRLG